MLAEGCEPAGVSWHQDEKSDAMVPGALYSEPGSEKDGGRREKMKKAADREEESVETV